MALQRVRRNASGRLARRPAQDSGCVYQCTCCKHPPSFHLPYYTVNLLGNSLQAAPPSLAAAAGSLRVVRITGTDKEHPISQVRAWLVVHTCLHMPHTLPHPLALYLHTQPATACTLLPAQQPGVQEALAELAPRAQLVPHPPIGFGQAECIPEDEDLGSATAFFAESGDEEQCSIM